MLKGYSQTNTYEIYKSHLNTILKKFPEPEEIDLLQIQDFAAQFKNDNTRKNVCVILRWLFNSVYNRNIQWYELPYPKFKKKVQPIYSEENIFKVLTSIQNEKQKAILALIIDCGLRISEPCGILIADCNSKERSIVLRSAKGDNDRVIYPSPKVWDLIKVYWNEWKKQKTEKYLFDGQKPGMPYCETSIRQTIKKHCNKTGVKYLGVHAIRRFMITWSIEREVPISVVASKAGHASTKTVERSYIIHSPTYLRNTASPLR
jgi:integrase